MRFEDAYEGWQARRLTQEEAARLLGVHERTFRRYINRFKDEALSGLADRRLSQVSHLKYSKNTHRHPLNKRIFQHACSALPFPP